MTFIVHLQHGLNSQDTAGKGHQGADSAAPLQVFQIVHSEPDAVLGNYGFQVEGVFFQRSARIFLGNGQIDHQTAAGGSGQCVHDPDSTVRVLLL